MWLCSVTSVVSDSVRPQRRQPTRLPCPWDSPGKNTGVGCHFLLQCMKVKSESEVAQSCPTLSDSMDCSLTRLLRPWDFPSKRYWSITQKKVNFRIQIGELFLHLYDIIINKSTLRHLKTRI